MEPKQKKEVIAALREHRLFDYLANHYWEMDKEDLKDIAKELAYAIELSVELFNDKTAYAQAMQNFKENL